MIREIIVKKIGVWFKYNQKWINIILNIMCALAAIAGSFVMLEYGSAVSVSVVVGSPMNMKQHIMGIDIRMLFINIMTIAAVWSTIYLLCSRVWLSGLITSVSMGLIAIINYYVAKLHGMPLSFLSLRNISTAMDVLSSYEIELNGSVVKLLIMLIMLVVVQLLLWMLTRNAESEKKHVRWMIKTGLAMICGTALFFGYYSPNPVKPQHAIKWLWTEAYSKYGYAACTMETLNQFFYAANMPDGYAEDGVNEIPLPAPIEGKENTPDVILILNETFYDINQIADPKSDLQYMGPIMSIEGLISGYAVVPGNGGGTNSAEYELLTSNSLELMPGITPFNALDLSNANSIVSHLRALGYATLGTHSESPNNYSRQTGYSDLGFDDIRFEDAYSWLDGYHNRNYASDSCLYEHLTAWYEDMPAELPRFMYMLTIQNHGGYAWNDPEHDLVHAKTDFGDNDDEVDEFLTSIYQSSQAFAELTAYFSKVERPVIICMVGDHCPEFGRAITDARYSEEERNLLLRKVPFVIWANYDLEETSLGTVSMNYVVPTLLDLADIQLSPFYQYQLELKESVPILTSYGKYYDKDGMIYHYETDITTPYRDQVMDYFYLEYHNLGKNRIQKWFDPQ